MVLVAFGCTVGCLGRSVVIERRTGMLVRRVVLQLVLRDLVLVAVRDRSVRRLVALMSSCGRCLRVRDV